MTLALVAYAAYAINALQFFLKLREARRDVSSRRIAAHDLASQP
jgi:hypothetical protein